MRCWATAPSDSSRARSTAAPGVPWAPSPGAKSSAPRATDAANRGPRLVGIPSLFRSADAYNKWTILRARPIPRGARVMSLGTQTQSYGTLLDYEQFVDHQLQRTRKRIKLTDIMTACLMLAVSFLGILFVEIVLDHAVGMPLGLRRVILVGGLAAGSAYAAFRIALPLVRRVNAIYAARTIEDSDPSFKNSLINYLVLRRQPAQLPKAVLATLESRAVNDLTHVDVEGAVNQHRLTQ